jgi:acyl-CoA dehydrogenase
LPNVATFVSQVQALGQLVMTAPPSDAQSQDLDFLQILGQLFTQVVYGQLICENAALAIDGDAAAKRASSVSDLSDLTEAHVDRMFAVFVQDVSARAVELHGQASSNEAQRAGALTLVKAPTIDPTAEAAFVDEVLSYDNAYVMNN